MVMLCEKGPMNRRDALAALTLDMLNGINSQIRYVQPSKRAKSVIYRIKVNVLGSLDSILIVMNSLVLKVRAFST